MVHVNDASRAVTVVGDLLQKERKKTYIKSIKDDYETFRTGFLARQKEKSYLTIEEARKNKYVVDWNASQISKPNTLGIQIWNDVDLKTLVEYIDWTPFFRSWDLHGRYPDIFHDKVVGKQAKELFEDAQALLKHIVDSKLLEARAVFGLFKANQIDTDDIEVWGTDETFVFRTLRQQSKKAKGKPNLALADFIAPKSSGIQDYIGCFCVSAGFGTKELADAYQNAQDDYNSIMVKALADRLAEAFAEYLHKEVRLNHWGYASDEKLSNEALIKEAYKGIRPAPGYPACPDHLEKETIWELLDVSENIGVQLTDSLAMWPAASVSGYYFAHQEARYFGLGKIKEDQVRDFAERKNISLEKAIKWLQPNLAD